MPPLEGNRPDEGNDPMLAQQRAGRARAAADDRQKHIVDEAARLLQLATELKESVDKSNKNELSLDVIRKADDIEKLAHDVKQRMRS
jgi:type VI protein secretion system component VasF